MELSCKKLLAWLNFLEELKSSKNFMTTINWTYRICKVHVSSDLFELKYLRVCFYQKKMAFKYFAKKGLFFFPLFVLTIICSVWKVQVTASAVKCSSVSGMTFWLLSAGLFSLWFPSDSKNFLSRICWSYMLVLMMTIQKFSERRSLLHTILQWTTY